MSACPFCQEQMRATFLEGLPREECGDCGAVWMEGEALRKVLGGSIATELVGGAKGQPGVCKGCEEPLQFVPSCPRCGLAAPTCPQCGTAPLPVVETLGVKVEVCGGCHGMALDAGELQQLREAAAAYRDEGLDLRVRVKQEGPPQCTACKRKLEPEHAFVWEERFYCGSCAPDGAAPYTGELSKAEPGEAPSPYQSVHPTWVYPSDSPASAALRWLLTRLFR